MTKIENQFVIVHGEKIFVDKEGHLDIWHNDWQVQIINAYESTQTTNRSSFKSSGIDIILYNTEYDKSYQYSRPRENRFIKKRFLEYYKSCVSTYYLTQIDLIS